MSVAFAQSAASVPAYEFVEVTLTVRPPPPGNPFLETEVRGQFARTGGQPVEVDGFCDSADGSLYRIRFLPTAPGAYHYSVTWRGPRGSEAHSGSFRASGPTAARGGAPIVEGDGSTVAVTTP